MIISQCFAACLLGIISSLLCIYLLIPLLNKIKAKQEILSYVKEHINKRGTATMGGIGFILAFGICALFLCCKGHELSIMVLIITLAYTIIGFLDDYIKIKYKRNQGLTAVQKTIAQLIIAIIIAIYIYTNNMIGSVINIPFINSSIDIGIWIIPLSIFVFLGGTNGVNLTDGLDGLATSVTIIVIIFLCVFSLLEINNLTIYSNTIALEYQSLAILCAIMSGVLIAFLIFNCNPARIFMGDTGSMGLGAFVTCISLFTRNILLFALLGIIYVVSVLSVIVQVIYFKISKGKRIFLMAPLHHHLQIKGLSETRIMVIYSTITFIMGAILLISTIGI